jgi:hypothetical protein
LSAITDSPLDSPQRECSFSGLRQKVSRIGHGRLPQPILASSWLNALLLPFCGAQAGIRRRVFPWRSGFREQETLFMQSGVSGAAPVFADPQKSLEIGNLGLMKTV